MTTPTSAKQWYLLYAKRRQEALAQEHLANQGFSSFFPRVFKRGRESEEALFPSYLFVQTSTQDNWRPIKYTRGVIGFVRFGKTQLPPPVAEELIEELRRRDYLRIARELHSLPGVGERIKLKLNNSNVEAIVRAHDGNSRVQVLFKLLNQYNSAWVDASQLRQSA